MELPVIIERLPDSRGYTARLATPIPLSAEGATAEEAHRELAALLRRRLAEGVELRSLTVPVPGGTGPAAGWLPDDELTRDWLQHMEDYRAECDAADRERLGETAADETPP
jgi:hypothetical protein